MKYDVVVVGAGPAGSTAARQCALKGLKTLLLEKEKLPRYKPCGGAVSEKSLSLLDFKINKELVERECYGAILKYGRYGIKARKPYRFGILTSRDKFDFYLTEKAVNAGVELHDSEKVRSLNVLDSHVVVKTDKTSYNASSVIGADGVNSIVSRQVRDRFAPAELGLSFEAALPYDVDNLEDPDLIRTFFGCAPGGYGWVFPKREHLSVGIVGILSRFKEPKRAFTDFMEKRGLDPSVRFQTHLIPLGGYKRETCSDRIILVGDAAGYADPFLWEGIQYAIHSGKIAAGVISGSYGGGDFSNDRLSIYKKDCFKAFGENLEHSLEFSRLIHQYPNILIRLVASNEPLISRYLDTAVGRLGYRAYRNWLLLRVPYYLLQNFICR
ncbi:MAG: geranylgeranyl reductase family protein [Candidatus Altiarchaeota archaeon]|nr:geranylgeranyl reductase family protein [Candidatus Altiarchaeota archaeon]